MNTLGKAKDKWNMLALNEVWAIPLSMAQETAKRALYLSTGVR